MLELYSLFLHIETDKEDMIKKIIGILTVLTLILLPTVTAHAQLRYGIRLGGFFSRPSLNNASTAAIECGNGFSGGLMLEYQIHGNGVAADIAVLYTRYSSRLFNASGAWEDPCKDFIEIPLHIKYKFWLPAFHNLFGPMVYTGPSLMIRTGDGQAPDMKIKRVQPGWDMGIGFDIVNFIQITGGYRFGLGNAISDFSGFPEACLRTNGWNISANLIFDF